MILAADGHDQHIYTVMIHASSEDRTFGPMRPQPEVARFGLFIWLEPLARAILKDGRRTVRSLNGVAIKLFALLASSNRENDTMPSRNFMECSHRLRGEEISQERPSDVDVITRKRRTVQSSTRRLFDATLTKGVNQPGRGE